MSGKPFDREHRPEVGKLAASLTYAVRDILESPDGPRTELRFHADMQDRWGYGVEILIRRQDFEAIESDDDQAPIIAAICHDCGKCNRVDEDGCCLSCGRDTIKVFRSGHVVMPEPDEPPASLPVPRCAKCNDSGIDDHARTCSCAAPSTAAVAREEKLSAASNRSDTERAILAGVEHLQAATEAGACSKCGGCGQVANTDDEEPWTLWEALPPESALAVRVGIVRPKPCRVCKPAGGVS